ncbi:ABC transporter permease [Pedobacter sp. JY14-1]|uniref:ABC transporter permease n=1 Tax=Pedobacter sp. JY14-1 TaxID=3034151 RepID=UPI0023E33E6D|nr:ABC transporter permease [Pedobacter sp. JY14-1]
MRYLRLSFRNFKKHKGAFLINLAGLSSGLTCAVLIYLWASSELQTDRFHQQDIYQVMQNEYLSDAVNTVDGTPGILAEALATEFPEVKKAVVTSPGYWLGHSKVGGGEYPNVAASGKFAGAEFFSVFSYPLLSGDLEQVLKGTKSAVISESLAMKLFNTTDVIGKVMVWSNAELQMENRAQVSGVFRDVPAQSSERFDFLISADVLLDAGNSTYRHWGNYGPLTYVVLNQDEDPVKFNVKIRDFLKTKQRSNYTLFVRPYGDAYLYNELENGKVVGGRISQVRLFGVVAVLILLTACINFTNLSTASASGRMKEIGVKKVLGVPRKKLIWQYLAESVLLSFIALFISLLAVELLLPAFNRITQKELSLDFGFRLMGMLTLLTMVTGLVAGFYPAVYLSGMKPVTALKGKLQFSTVSLWLRQGLVVFQFVVSGVLIIAVLVVYRQIRYVQTGSQGFKKENVVYFETEGRFKSTVPFVLEAVRRTDGVLGAGGIDRELLGDLSYTTGSFNWEGRNQQEEIRFQRADVTPGLIETLGMKMVLGRSFSERFGSDTSAVIINEAGIRAMRLKDPVGKVFTLWGREMQIIGVLADFHFESMHKKVGPMFIRCKPANANRVMLRVAPGRLDAVLDALRTFNQRYNPGYSLDYKFLDQDFERQYMAERRMAALSRYFAVLTILLCCLGLFGLAAFAAEKRFKEIGIRKVLGASNLNLMYLLSGAFLRPVLISVLIAMPLAYVLCMHWLSSFAYRIELHWWFFATGGLLAVLIALVTVSFQVYKAASADPVVSLKTE